jgi:HTH-type transcriptional regulator / antitoxin HigA
MLKPITNRREHRAALKRIDRLMGARAGSRESAELQVLAILVERYERETFPIAPPSPVDAIRFRMEQMGKSQADLARLLGSRSRASEILRGRLKSLPLSVIRRLHDEWRIPADVLIRRAA